MADPLSGGLVPLGKQSGGTRETLTRDTRLRSCQLSRLVPFGCRVPQMRESRPLKHPERFALQAFERVGPPSTAHLA